MTGANTIRRLGRRLRSRRRDTSEGEFPLRAAYADHAGELFQLAFRSLGDQGLAEEVVQETFVRAWRSSARFDERRGSVRTWLFAIARNLIVDAARARAVRSRAAGGEREEEWGVIGVTEDPTEKVLLGMQMEEALKRLSEDHHRVILEIYYRGRPYAEVAEEIGVSPSTLRSRTYYALKSLRLVLEEMGWSDES
ncbi:MAG: sigma-70 family RNA polymerase sigma factor [Actinomycetota bacterium]|nr:sigma-70 family RNA polymerase sigma factor [Actinomycetota bacterium]